MDHHQKKMKTTGIVISTAIPDNLAKQLLRECYRKRMTISHFLRELIFVRYEKDINKNKKGGAM